MVEEKRVAVVILNWNGRSFLEQFLPKIIQYSANTASIIIADNASTDDSIAFLKENFSGQVSIIQLPENYGFAGGYNRALEQVKAKYYVLLNSDVEVTEGWLDTVIEYMDANDAVAACQPKLRAFHAKSEFEYAGAAGGYIDYLGYPFCRGRVFNHLEKDNGQYDKIEQVFWATGACLFIRSECFHQVQGFDADFFAHMEEIDLCWRLQNQGYQIKCIPSSVVYHVGGGTLPKGNPRKTFLNFRNNLIMLLKNLPSNKVFGVIAARLILDGVAGFKFLIEGDAKDCLAVIKAHFSFYSLFQQSLKKRRMLQMQKVVESKSFYKKSLLVAFYLKGRKTFQQLGV